MVETVLLFTYSPTNSAERFKTLSELVLIDEKETEAGSETSDGSALGKRNMVITLPLHAAIHNFVLYFLHPSPPFCPSGGCGLLSCGGVFGYSILNVTLSFVIYDCTRMTYFVGNLQFMPVNRYAYSYGLCKSSKM